MMFRRTFALVAVALGLAVACAPDVDSTPVYDYGLFPSVAHSGFNATATFKVMFATSAPDPRWTVDDPSIATIVPSDPPILKNVNTKGLEFALATMTKAGTTTVTMTSGDTVLTSELDVTAYSNDQLAIGKARYEVGTAADATRTPCKNCHQQEGGVDHSPLKMAGFDDPTVLGVIQNATYPDVATGGSTTSAFSPRGPLSFTGHKWNLTEPEKEGILSYLRSLPLGTLKKIVDPGVIDGGGAVDAGITDAGDQ